MPLPSLSKRSNIRSDGTGPNPTSEKTAASCVLLRTPPSAEERNASLSVSSSRTETETLSRGQTKSRGRGEEVEDEGEGRAARRFIPRNFFDSCLNKLLYPVLSRTRSNCRQMHRSKATTSRCTEVRLVFFYQHGGNTQMGPLLQQWAGKQNEHMAAKNKAAIQRPPTIRKTAPSPLRAMFRRDSHPCSPRSSSLALLLRFLSPSLAPSITTAATARHLRFALKALRR